MKGWIEVPLFAAMAIAAHLVFFAANPTRGSKTENTSSDTPVLMAGATTSTAQMVQEWDQPPETTPVLTPPIAPPQVTASPTVPKPALDVPVARPDLAQSIPQVDMPDPNIAAIDTTPAPLRFAPEASERPQTRPTTTPRAAPEPQSAQQQAPSSNTTPAPSQPAPAAAPTASQIADLQAQWGTEIRARVERRKRFPAGTRGSGQVVVSITVSSTGQLVSYALQRSSGVDAFDQSALQAVSRAGRFPAAPAALQGRSYQFSLPISFSR